MPDANHHDIRVLNTLIDATLDSARGYGVAADQSDDDGHRTLFERRSFERQAVAATLQTTVRGLGGASQAEGSLLAKAQRALGDAAHALMRDEAGAVGAAQSGEDRTRARFERALEDSEISPTTRETIRRAYASMAGEHDQLRDLKHSLQGQRDAANRLFPQ